MTAADTTSRLIEADAKAMADKVTQVAVNVAAWASALGFGAAFGAVLFLAVTR
ncbi:hypothetical protein [Cellulomonas denverensis]|uniref:Uncharacterized protein n=1 Tax=Cellulomonas denverensis TaxID=264297 RepID=A0A7X6QYI2_9CELL|nr:hypothetical protein [Cellulomonas denverensis]NKY22180.1 hypothetical protein [Cellulomonas denverensis]GIG27143.1 hypothetical protein Cde04nite_33870 [Cellulomonas denverensis]